VLEPTIAVVGLPGAGMIRFTIWIGSSPVHRDPSGLGRVALFARLDPGQWRQPIAAPLVPKVDDVDLGRGDRSLDPDFADRSQTRIEGQGPLCSQETADSS
jgi:hypothetical protein